MPKKFGKTTASAVRITGKKHHVPRFSATAKQTKKGNTGG